MFMGYNIKMDPLEVPTDTFMRVKALKTGGSFLARRIGGGKILTRNEDGEERTISNETFGKLYRKADRRR